VWTESHVRLIRAAALKPRVMRIFVNPALKKGLCRSADQNPSESRTWLNKVRPMWGHNYHFHIRMQCPQGESGCADQEPPSSGDGCGQELTDWLALQQKALFAPKKPSKPAKPKPEMSVDALPAECKTVLLAR
jgi:penicillin-insensitive murein DD-endopeptidase